MKIDGTPYRSVWVDADGWSVRILDQTKLPWQLDILRLADEAGVAQAIADDDAETCRRIGEHGLPLLREIHARKPAERVNVLTHCNAGWLATVDWGTATAPIYLAHDRGHAIHVWVDETRPR